MFLFGWPSFQCNCYSAFCCKRGQWNHVRIIYVFVFSLDIISELVLGFLDLSLSIYWLPLLAHALLKTGSTCGSHPKFVQTRFPKYGFWLCRQLLKLCHCKEEVICTDLKMYGKYFRKIMSPFTLLVTSHVNLLLCRKKIALQKKKVI